MATSTITFYSTNISPDRNAIVDNLKTYLNNCLKKVISNFQYQKMQMNMKLKIDKEQTNFPKNLYNYVSIQNLDSEKTYYYFIVGEPRWLSTSTIEYTLYMDTLNTFNSDLVWTPQTHITRQHKDRYYNDKQTALGMTTITRKIDNYDEGINPVKYLIAEEKIYQKLDQDWYLIYRNKQNITAETNVPVECQCCAGTQLPTNATVRNGLNESDVPNKSSVLILAYDNAADFVYTTAAGTSYTIGKKQTYKGLLLVKYDGQRDFSAFGITNLGDTQNKSFETNRSTTVLENYTVNCHQFNGQIISGNISYPDAIDKVLTETNETFTIGSSTLKSIDEVDRTDTQIIKIIKMPYAPFEISQTNNKLDIPGGWQFINGFLVLQNLNTEFLTTVKNDTVIGIKDRIITSTLVNYKNVKHSSQYESKLYNSAFYTQKYVYDNFEKEILLERYSPNTGAASHEVTVKFKQSNNISSNSLFDFSFSNGVYHKVAQYDQFLNVNRTNEVALYNSDYLNYIRNGYNYDKKVLSQQQVANWIGVGISAASSVASFALSANPISAAAGISFVSQAISSVANSINQSIAGEAAIQQKLDEYQKRPASVSNTTDLDLLSYYNGNRLWNVRESISDNVKNGIYNLFRLTGYGCDEYSIPKMSGRVWYNFIQCSPEFDETQWNYGDDVLKDIKDRYQTGATCYHSVDGEYDWKQEKENFETWLVSNT